MITTPEAVIQARAALAAPLRRAWAELTEPGTVLRVHEEALDAPEASPWLRLTLTPRFHEAPLHIEHLTVRVGGDILHRLRVEARLDGVSGALPTIPASLSWTPGSGALVIDGLRWPLDAVRWSPDDLATRTVHDLTRAIGQAVVMVTHLLHGTTLLSLALDDARAVCEWQIEAAVVRPVEACVVLVRDHDRLIAAWEAERTTSPDTAAVRMICALAHLEASEARHDLLVQLAARPLPDDAMRHLIVAALLPALPAAMPAAMRDVLERHPDTRTLWAVWKAAPGHVSRLMDAGLARRVWLGTPPPDPARAWRLLGPIVLAHASPGWLPGGAPVVWKRALWAHLCAHTTIAARWGALVEDAMQSWGEPPEPQLRWWREAVEALVDEAGADALASPLNTPARRAVRAWLPEDAASSAALRALGARLDDAQS